MLLTVSTAKRQSGLQVQNRKLFTR